MNKTKIICNCLLALSSLVLAVFAIRYAYYRIDLSKLYLLYVIGAVVLYLLVVFCVFRFVKAVPRKVTFYVGAIIIPIILSCCTFLFAGKFRPTTYRLIGKHKSISYYERSFVDLQATQLKAAQKNGIKPFETRKAAKSALSKMREENKLVKISSNSKCYVRHLTHSLPYVVPKAEKLIADIAVMFQKKTDSKSRFEITSVLRTKEDNSKLRKSNSLATRNSCHFYGTTFDISYSQFKHDPKKRIRTRELRTALASVLANLRKEKRCYVKFERNQCCYHITVR